jgi:hypothetical protein
LYAAPCFEPPDTALDTADEAALHVTKNGRAIHVSATEHVHVSRDGIEGMETVTINGCTIYGWKSRALDTLVFYYLSLPMHSERECG